MVDFMGETWALFINVVYSAMRKILSGFSPPTLAQIFNKICLNTSSGRWINPRRSSGPRYNFGIGGRWLGNLTPQNGSVELEHRFALYTHRQEVCQHWKKINGISTILLRKLVMFAISIPHRWQQLSRRAFRYLTKPPPRVNLYDHEYLDSHHS